jgi:hypothetical protein
MTSSPTWTRQFGSSEAPPTLEDIQAAGDRLRKVGLQTPLVRLNVEDAPADIYLKLENLQPVGSFKLRGAGNALLLAKPDELREGVWTASARNMALALAWHARSMGVRCTAIVPGDAPPAKLDPLKRLGARIIQVPFAQYQQIQRQHHYAWMGGLRENGLHRFRWKYRSGIIREYSSIRGSIRCFTSRETHALWKSGPDKASDVTAWGWVS